MFFPPSFSLLVLPFLNGTISLYISPIRTGNLLSSYHNFLSSDFTFHDILFLVMFQCFLFHIFIMFNLTPTVKCTHTHTISNHAIKLILQKNLIKQILILNHLNYSFYCFNQHSYFTSYSLFKGILHGLQVSGTIFCVMIRVLNTDKQRMS